MTRDRSQSPAPCKIQEEPPQIVLPLVDVFLDPSIIPSLPPPGGHVGHAELMGRPRVIPSPLPSQSLPLPGSSPPVPPKDTLRVPGRAGLIRRSSSFEDRRGNRAGVGAGRQSSTLDLVHSVKNSSMRKATPSPPRPAVIRRISSFESQSSRSDPSKGDLLPRPTPPGTRRRALGGRRHQRTASDSTTSTVTSITQSYPRAEPASNALSKHSRSNSSIPSFFSSLPVEGCIRLLSTASSSDRETQKVAKILVTLHSLIPPSRVPDIPVPPPSSGMLHPSTLLTPLAIILEALVMERSVLRSDTSTSPNSLPVLRDGTRLQIPGGEGELDWGVMRPYILAVGSVLSSLIPYLRENTHNKEKHKVDTEVESLSKGLRVYVSKHKKVFGEVATMYVDGYGFMKGWWDESGMKGCAGEVGRWGDLVGV